jgi:hypothetical protein
LISYFKVKKPKLNRSNAKGLKISILSSINEIACLFLIAIYMVPFFRVNINFVIIAFTLFMWFLTAIIIDTRWLKKCYSIIAFSVISILVAIFFFFLNQEIEYIYRFFSSTILFFVFPFFYLFYENVFNPTKLKNLCFKIVFIILITCITTINGLQMYPNAARLLASGSESMHVYMYKNIGGYGFIYAIVFLAGVLLLWLRQGKYKIYLGVALFILYLTIINAGYTMGLILSIVLLSINIIFFGTDKTLGGYFYNAFLVTVLCIVFIYRIEIIEFILTQMDNLGIYMVSVRVGQIRESLLIGTFDNLQRTSLYKMSWDMFIANPLVGSMGLGIMAGGHSEILDILATHGIFGFGLLGLLTTSLVKVYKNVKVYKKVIYSIVLIFVAFSCINTIFTSKEIAIIILFVMPMIVNVIEQEK